jgi:gamma-glutamylcyclotransferase (GGCT)/AIG2-like uncharacterized protein YtfP
VKKGDLLFTYGTLRPGEHADLSNNFATDHVGQDSIIGTLYHLGGYPGLKLEGDDPVYGDVFKLRNDNIVAILDMYEGYPSLYSRSVVRAKSGRSVWVYTYNPSVEGRREVPGGDWKKRIEVHMYEPMARRA